MRNPRGITAKRVTIHEVARDAGVSKTSVSRYLGNERKLLSEPLQQRIADSIKRLEFYPDRIASSLRGRRTRLIGMVVADITNPSTVQMMRGIENECYKRGYTLLVCNTNNQSAQESEHLEVLRSYNVEGLVIHTLGHMTTSLQRLIEDGLPVVMVDRIIEGIKVPSIGLDNEQAIRLGVGHLVEQGFEHILLVTEPVAGISSRTERKKYFLNETGKRAPTMSGTVLEIAIEDNMVPLHHALRELSSHQHAAAVFCANASIALHVAKALTLLGLSEQLGVLSIDEEPWSELVLGGISTLSQPTAIIGESAVQALCQTIESGHSLNEQRRFPAQLHERRSTMVHGRTIMHDNTAS